MDKKKEMLKNSDIKEALIKRALGFDAIDEVKEYAVDENEKLKLTKKKVTKKFVSPDISAVKTLLEVYFSSEQNEFDNMTTEELLLERDKLLKHLKEEEEKEK